jgi:predicted nucleotide-binding protein
MATKTTTTSVVATAPTVTPQQGIVLVQKLIDKAADLAINRSPLVNSADNQAFTNLANDILGRVFGEGSRNIASVNRASGGSLHVGMDDHDMSEYYRKGFQNKITILKGCIEQLETTIELQAAVPPVQAVSPPNGPAPVGTKVFIVHGHDHGLKEAAARLLSKLGLEPVILHEQPNQNRTLIEKFSAHADVQFAVVLLTGDDLGRPKDGDALKPRARQNVIFELGYFIGALGRDKVCAIYEPGVEMPSDYQGVAFVEYKGDHWRHELFRELHAAGFDIDANRLFGKG